MKHPKILIALLAGATCLGAAVPGRAGLSEQEKALWGASSEAPTTFVVPAAKAGAVLDKAQALIAGWAATDRYMWPMPVRTHTARLVATAEPTALNGVGFTVTDTEAGGAAVIAVETSAFTDKAFQASQQRRDAGKRAHLLAYLLEQFAGVPTTPSLLSVSGVTLPGDGAAPGDSAFDAALQRLRTQLGAGQYEAALETLDGLRATVAARARAGSAAGRK